VDKKTIIIAIIIGVCVACFFSYRCGSNRSATDYQSRIDDLTKSNTRLEGELETANGNLSRLTRELSDATNTIGELDDLNSEHQATIDKQRELLDRYSDIINADGERISDAEGGLGRAVSGVDQLIEEIRNSQNLGLNSVDNSNN
jgi:predicted  nucleic acid-binding Zn-ribbon protein